MQRNVARMGAEEMIRQFRIVGSHNDKIGARFFSSFEDHFLRRLMVTEHGLYGHVMAVGRRFDVFFEFRFVMFGIFGDVVAEGMGRGHHVKFRVARLGELRGGVKCARRLLLVVHVDGQNDFFNGEGRVLRQLKSPYSIAFAHSTRWPRRDQKSHPNK